MAIEIRTNARLMAGFIPHRLEIKDRPELNDFPFNVLFGNFITINGVDFTATALYTPLFDTYKVEKDKSSLAYRNIYGTEGTLTITKHKDEWEGVKSVNGKPALFAFAKEWHRFFIQLTSPGLSNEESCSYERVDSKGEEVN